MDKFEYRIKADEIKELIAQKEYEQAAEIADTIDWRRVKSVMMLCTISDLYKMCRRYEDSRDMLLLAYDRHPGGRTILYSLCELSIKMEEFVQAVEYYKEFVQIAPKDTGRYILQYKLYEAQDVSLEERIAVLEELKEKDYREKWAYELAYLYHRVGLAAKCVEECDELELWFGNGKYVIKALELKRLHAPLTEEQQYKYDHRFGEPEEESTGDAVEEAPAAEAAPEQTANGGTAKLPVEEMDIQVKTLDVGKYDTINLQEELAAGIQEYFGNSKDEEITRSIMGPMLSGDTRDITLEAMKAAALTMQAAQTAGAGEVPAGEPESEVFFGETGEIEDVEQQELFPLSEEKQDVQEDAAAQNTPQAEMPASRDISSVLAMEGDGQISFVLPEKEKVEKQITGQISFDDILLEWEKLKKENEEKRKEEVRQRVLQQTGPIFVDFEKAKKQGLLEQLENNESAESLEEIFEGGQETGTAAGELEDLSDLGTLEDAEDLPGEDAEGNPEEAEFTEELPEADAAENPEEAEIAEELPEADAAENPEETEIPEELPEEDVPEDLGEVEELTEIEPVSGEAVFAEGADGEVSEEELPEAETTVEADEDIPAEEDLFAEELEELEADIEADVEAEEVAEAEAERLANGQDTELTEDAPAEEMPEEENVEVTAEDVPEEIPEEAAQEPVPEQEPVVREKHRVRNLTREERELYGAYIQGRSSKEMLIQAIDGISMAAYTGNVIVTGDEGMDSMGLAKNIIREVQMTDSNFSGRIAKISGDSLNTRDVKQIIDNLNNGALIIQKASLMQEKTGDSLYRALQQENRGIVVVLEDTKRSMDRFLARNEKLLSCFTSRMDLAALSDDALVAFARKYAREKEYSIDEMGLLALHTRIADMQSSDHAVTILEVKEIMDEAIENANRKSIGHFFDILFNRRYDDEDMIILKEKDFI